MTANLQSPISARPILGVNVAVSSYDEVVQRSLAWAARRESRAIVFCNVHMIMEAVDDPAFSRRLNEADLVNPDGMPLVWALRALRQKNARRVCGPDATEVLLAAAQEAEVPVGFYGSSQPVLDALAAVIGRKYPRLKIVFAESPPFRPLSPEEDKAVVARIASSGARLLFVGLGCPKQENWVMEHRGRVPAVMFAVGAAFDFLAGNKARAPHWMQRLGLEWLFRFVTEPRRLAMRYLKHNPRFVIGFLRQLLAQAN